MKKQLLLTLGLVSLLVSAVQASQEQLAASIRETRNEATRTREQLKATLDSITALTAQKEGDLRPAYNAFAAEVPKTEMAASWTATRVQWMAGDGQRYFDTWQGTINSISNKSLQKKAQKRFDDAKKSYDKISLALKDAGEKFRPFLSDLSDIQKALANDVTAAGVRNVRSTVKDANFRYGGVSSAIEKALKEMDKMQASLSSEK